MNRLGIALLTAALCVTSAASATPLQLNPVHKAKYSDGVKKQSAGDYATALVAFESIPVDERSYDTRLHIASCRSRLGRLLSAAEELEAIIAVAKTDKLPAGQREAIIDTAKSDLDELLLETPHLAVAVTARSANLVVTVDGIAVTAPVDRVLDPGAHVVVATRDNREVFRREVTLERRAKAAVEIDVAPPVVAVLPARAPHAPAPRDDTRSPALAYVALGGGVAFGALAVVGFMARSSAYDDYKATCDTAAGCDPDLRAPVRKWEAISYTSAGLAVASIGVGVYLLATKPTANTTVAIGPGSIELRARF